MASTIKNSSESFSLRWKRSLVTVIAVSLLLPFFLAIIREVQLLDDQNIPCCDYAVLDLNTSAFLRGEQLVGPYSRQGWYHPGPLGVGWYSIFRILPGSSFAQYQIAAITLAVLAMGFFLWQLRKHPLVVIAISSAILLFWSTRFGWNYFLDPWNPISAMFWVVAFLAATISAFTFKKRSLIVASAILGGIAIQTHIGSTPTVLFSIFVLAIALWKSRSTKEFIKDALWFIGTSFFVWLLPLWDFFFRTHNFRNIITINDSPVSTGGKIGEIAKNVVQLLVLSPTPQGKWLGSASVFFPPTRLTFFQILFFIVLCGLCLNVIRRRHDFKFEFLALVMCSGSTFFTVCFLLLSQSDYAPYVLLPIVGLGAILWISCISVVVQDLVARFGRSETINPQQFQKMLILIGLSASLLFSGLAVRQIPNSKGSDVFATKSEQELNQAIRLSCGNYSSGERVAFSPQIEWTEGIRIFADLNRCAKMTTYGFLGFIAGDAYNENTENEMTLFVARTKSEVPEAWPITVETPQFVIAKVPKI